MAWMRKGWIGLLSVVFLGVVAVCFVTAQPPSFPNAYAIVNARVFVGDGRVLERATVLIRDGIIEAVGENLAVPPDAEVIEGKDLTVYPGFIDAHTTQGLKLPEWKPDQDEPPDTVSDAHPFMRLANRKGIRPELRAFDCLDLTPTVLVPYRQAGFTTALFAPSGGAINGVSALVNLSGEPKRECVVKSVVAMHFAFTVPRTVRGYPSSLMGIFAHMRQTLLDAHYFRALQAAFESGGGKRPPADESLLALQPVLSGSMPVIFDADTENEIRRAIKFADEFGLKVIISGAREGWKVAEELARQKIPVIVSLAFGPEPRRPSPRQPSPERTQTEQKPEPQPPEATAEEEPVSPERTEEAELPDVVWKERLRLWQERVANAAKLHDAGVVIAFTTRGVRNLSEFWQNLRRAIQAGLPKEAALKALTVNPAKLFGVDKHLGTVEKGKAANLVVMTGDFTDEKARVRYLFIDGRKFEPERERIPAPQPTTEPTFQRRGLRLPIELPPEEDCDGCLCP
ncbi:amidohydrolase family protein [Fervidibacter sacchari]|uniref:Imidazolonepropionase-like amidohydrolase n=1 Tax=Candidatus Fervidibacter sacchari TaxID=1448929 RepID=A0ABT2EPQ2_9BACT|nr:amidohydrolase family protein [Candidatus Fervidibacter sacchari]MCS3919936.1 imidazolonepropionase-like amidohydrolase [Candidatus Fervidibacter sacchari]WKU16827.1 amidohydrolase family protein [Candidatus Fervidibacter sacchari]